MNKSQLFHKFALLIFSLVVSLFVLSGCDQTTTSQNGEPEKVLRVGTLAEPIKLDPQNANDGASAIAYWHIVEGLVSLGKDGELAPSLATSWEFSEDGLHLTAELRPDVTFHDGTELNAEAIKTNFDRLLDPDLNLLGFSPFKDMLESTDVIDEQTIRFNLKEPNAAFVFELANTYSRIMSPESLKRPVEEIAQNPIGTGPFKFEEWVPNQYVSVDAFDDYWAGRPQIDRITYIPIPDPAARVAALEAGDIDVAINPPIVEADRLSALPNFQVLTGNSVQALHYQLNHQKEPLQDVRVRQALNYAIDLDSIIDTFYYGLATPLDSFISPAVPAHTAVGPYEYDPEKAKALLEEAGYGDGLKLVLWSSDGRYIADRQLAESVAGYLRDVGVELEIVTFEWGTYLDKIMSPPPDAPAEYDMAIMNASPLNGDAGQAWRNFLHSDSHPPAYENLAFYSNQEVDSLIEEAQALFDDDERNAKHAEIQELAWNDAPWIFLISPQQVVAASDKLQGTEFNLLVMTFDKAWLEE